MKKALAILLALSLLLAFAACGPKDPQSEPASGDPVAEQPEKAPEQQPEDQPEEKPEEKPEQKPEEKPEAPEVKPGGETPAEQKPAEQPAEQPEASVPATTPSQPQEPAPESPKTVGQQLLSKFKSVAAGKSAEAIAAELVAGDSLPFMAATAPMSEGFLNGFDADITGFSDACMFGPMIGTIPFIGYVFTLPAGADVNAFISNLRANANLRWNICTAAEEMVTGNVGNTVFFVMCPSQFEE